MLYKFKYKNNLIKLLLLMLTFNAFPLLAAQY